MKLLTELTTLDAALTTAEICAEEGLEDRPLTALSSESKDDLTALVSLGKALFAELTRAVALLCKLPSCACKLLTLLLAFRLVSPEIDFWRLLRSVQ